MAKGQENYVIGVDGGGTKTTATLADLKSKILARAKTGSSNPLKVDKKIAIDNIGEVIEKVSKKYPKNKIAFIYIALAGGLERDKKRKSSIKSALLKQPKLSWIPSKNLTVEGDQLAAFRSGTNKKEGVVLIAGTGSIVIGWHKGKEAIAGGRDYLLGDIGSGFWMGQKTLQVLSRSFNNLAPKTHLSRLVFKKLKIKNEGDLLRKIYKPEAVEIIASIAPLIDRAAEKGDKTARTILIEAAQKLATATNQVIKKLKFSDKKFPLVLAGSVFNSKIILSKVKKEIKRTAPCTEFIRPKEEAIMGAVKLAIEHV